MDHKGSISLLISFLRINMLFHGSGSSYLTTKSPQRLTQILHIVLFRNWTEVQGKIDECNQNYSQYPLGPKTLGAPTM
jgi:hypothetical protein